MNYGFIKVASAIPSVRVGDVKYNTAQIENLIAQGKLKVVGAEYSLETGEVLFFDF